MRTEKVRKLNSRKLEGLTETARCGDLAVEVEKVGNGEFYDIEPGGKS